MPAGQNKFRALYYPYSRCLYESDLKRVALVFDEILFVDPFSSDVTDHPGQYPIYNPNIKIRSAIEHPKPRFGRLPPPREFDLPKWYDVSSTYKILKTSGVAQLVDPHSHIQQHEQILTYSLVADLIC